MSSSSEGVTLLHKSTQIPTEVASRPVPSQNALLAFLVYHWGQDDIFIYYYHKKISKWWKTQFFHNLNVISMCANCCYLFLKKVQFKLISMSATLQMFSLGLKHAVSSSSAPCHIIAESAGCREVAKSWTWVKPTVLTCVLDESIASASDSHNKWGNSGACQAHRGPRSPLPLQWLTRLKSESVAKQTSALASIFAALTYRDIWQADHMKLTNNNLINWGLQVKLLGSM